MRDETTSAVSANPGITGTANTVIAGNPALAASVGCPTCGHPSSLSGPTAAFMSGSQPIYAVGRLSVQFPTIGAEKEFAQLTSGAYQGGQAEVDLLRQVLSRPENAYFGRYLAWVFTCGGVDAFTVLPRQDSDVAQLAEMLSPAEAEEVVHVIVGKITPAPIDSPAVISGLPTVHADRVLAFTLQEFAAAMPEDEPSEKNSSAPGNRTGRAEFETLVHGVFLRLTRGAALPGFSDEDRARAYVGSQYAPFYHAVRRAQRDGKVLVGVYTRHSHSVDRRVVSVGFTVRHPQTDVTERHQCLVDVTEPSLHFMVAGLRLVYD